jgi:hypothetical protein
MREAIYFSHDSNAKDDPKCMLLIDQLGLEGYGAFWILVEILREQPGYRCPISLLPILAKRYNITAAKLETVVRSFGLFVIAEDSFFFSNSLNKRMETMDWKKEQKRLAGIASGAARRLKSIPQCAVNEDDNNCNERCSNDVQTEFEQNEQKKRKEKKYLKEIYKEKASAFIPPTVGDVQDYCKERNNKIDAAYFVDFYASKGWMVGKNKMKDWQAAVRTWERTENTNIKSSNRNEQTENQSSRYKQL